MSTAVEVTRAGNAETTLALRLVLAFAATVVAVTGFLLFVLSECTDEFFAWTIKSPLTAAFMGASYWGTIPLELGGAREKSWANARVGVPAIWAFTVVTLGVTLLHHDRFHFQDADIVPAGIAWGWLALYVLVPAGLTLAWLRQRPFLALDVRTVPLPVALRTFLAVAGAALILTGLALLLAPLRLASVWPWPLTDLTGRAVGAWVLGFGLLSVFAGHDGDSGRTRVAFPSLVAWPVLHAAAVLRFPDELDWGSSGGIVLIVAEAAFFVAGSWGLLVTRKKS